MSISLIVASAGIGKRFSSAIKKQFYLIDDKPLLYYTLKRMTNAYNFDELVLGLNSDDFKTAEGIIKDLDLNINVKFIEGGKERFDTVMNCVKSACGDFVAVHDAVRPFASDETVKNTIEMAYKTGCSICGMPVRDTVKKVEGSKVLNTISRDNLFLAHTPQVFRRDILIKVLDKAKNDNIFITDESSACEYSQIEVTTVLSNSENIKVTYMEDTGLLEIYKNKFF